MRLLTGLVILLLGLSAPAVVFAQDVISTENADTTATIEDGFAAHSAGDFTRAAEIWRALAEKGNAAAQFNLGIIYNNGEDVPLDDAEAVKWYRLAAGQGYARAQFKLGIMYDNGRGFAKDDAEAVAWYSVAAAQGISSAQNNLGFIYEVGRGRAKRFGGSPYMV